jgi:hypothetical protein
LKSETISDYIDTLESSQNVSEQLCEVEQIDIVFTENGLMTKRSSKIKDPYDSIESKVKG